MTAWAIEALFASAALVALVLCLRVPVRRAFGPGVAYALWALPALRLALPPMPVGWLRAAPAPLAAAGEQVMMLIRPASAPVAEGGPPLVGIALVALWAAGASLFLGWQALAYRRFVRRVAASGVMLGRVGRIALVRSTAVADPLAYGVARPVVAVPTDFSARYDSGERELALAHEIAHHARGDMVANWVALLVLALHWFNPLAWIAFRAFRADQEMANDAYVLARRGAVERYAYGCALAKAAGVRPTFLSAPAAACGLNTVSDLKGRLRMLATTTSRARRIVGAATIGSVTLALLGLTASGGAAAESVRARVEGATGVPLAALSPTALLQEGPTAPPAPPGPTAPGSGGRHVATVRDGESVHVTVTEDGRTRHYAGAEAEAWLAAHPQPIPPTPPVATVPPAPPAPAEAAMATTPMKVIVRDRRGDIRSRTFGAPAAWSDAPQVESLDCPPGEDDRQMVLDDRKDGKRRVIICTDRIAAVTRQAAQVAANSTEIRRSALNAALSGLRASRASMTANHDMAEWERAEVRETIDRSIRSIEAQLARIG